MVKKYTYQELEKMSKNHILLTTPSDLGREEAITQKLKDDFKKFEEQGLSVNEKVNTLPILYTLNEIQNNNSREMLRITETFYPYYTDCRHIVLWIYDRNRFHEKQIIDLIKSLGFNKFIIWENPIGKRSVPEIQHYQILIKSE
jgi:3-deoxy-D-arabino-heptulosonate 7-phosphate (DAHP) synthase class II